jgi:hypothetical protein
VRDVGATVARMVVGAVCLVVGVIQWAGIADEDLVVVVCLVQGRWFGEVVVAVVGVPVLGGRGTDGNGVVVMVVVGRAGRVGGVLG